MQSSSSSSSSSSRRETTGSEKDETRRRVAREGGGSGSLQNAQSFLPIEGNEFEGNLLKAGSGPSAIQRRVNGVARAGRASRCFGQSSRQSEETETGSAGICITKRAINKVLRCRGHRQKSISSFQPRSCNPPPPCPAVSFSPPSLASVVPSRAARAVRTESKGRQTM